MLNGSNLGKTFLIFVKSYHLQLIKLIQDEIKLVEIASSSFLFVEYFVYIIIEGLTSQLQKIIPRFSEYPVDFIRCIRHAGGKFRNLITVLDENKKNKIHFL